MSAADPFGLVGQVLDGQFRVDKLVGEGGFSAVYQGHHQGLNEPIAVKCLKLPTTVGPSLVDTFVQRFRDESRILYRLSQGNLHVVRSIAAGTTPSPATGALVPYMVLEWLEGRTVQSDFTVRRSIGQKGRSLEVVRTLFETAADGLAYAHAQGVVHRDLNPGNLFLARTKLGVTMKVLDFGVAKLMHEGALDMGPRAQTTGHIRIFAPAYGAPEQFDDRLGAVGASADVYAFALILLEALLDKSVVEAGNLGEYARRATDPSRRPTPRALGLEVSDEVEQVFARATALDPAQRWPSAREFWQALTIAQKLSTERAYEQAARETPSLPAAGVPGTLPLPGARGEPANPARTMPLNALGPEQLSSVARAGTAGAASREAPRRARMATTIGIPAPAGSSAQPPRAPVAPVAAAPAPARPAVPTVGAPKDAPARLPFPSQPPRATPVPPPAVAPRGGARADSSPPGPLTPPPVAPPPRATARPPAAAAARTVNLPAVPPAPPPRPAVRDEPPISSSASNSGRSPAPTERFVTTPQVPGPPEARTAPPPAFATAPGHAGMAPYGATPFVADEEEDEATKVVAPSNEVLRTLAFQDAQNARLTALAAADAANKAAARPAGGPSPRGAPDEGAADAFTGGRPPSITPVPPSPHGGTLLMAPAENPGHAAAQAAGQAQAQAAGQAQAEAQRAASKPTTLAMQPGPAPLQAGPGGGAGAPPPFGPAGTSQQAQGNAPFGTSQQAQGNAPFGTSTGQGNAPFGTSTGQGNAPFGAPPAQPSTFGPGALPAHFARPSLPPPSGFPGAGRPAKGLPVVPIAIGLAVLALGGVGLGMVALRARPSPVGKDVPSAFAVSASTPPASAAPPPVTAAPASAVVVEQDASVAFELEDAAPSASASASASASPAASAPAPSASAAAPAPPPPPPWGTPPPVAPPPPAPSASVKPVADPTAFSEAAARAKLGQSNGVLAFCKKDGGVTGPGSASITFGPDGTVASVVVAPPYAGTKEGDCVASQFRRAKVSPFVGANQTVRHTFEVPK